jgi:hypothetical protein
MEQKTEEQFLDGNGKQIKKHTFTYTANGLKSEKKIFDANNTLISTKKYVYTTK